MINAGELPNGATSFDYTGDVDPLIYDAEWLPETPARTAFELCASDLLANPPVDPDYYAKVYPYTVRIRHNNDPGSEEHLELRYRAIFGYEKGVQGSIARVIELGSYGNPLRVNLKYAGPEGWNSNEAPFCKSWHCMPEEDQVRRFFEAPFADLDQQG